MQNHGLFSFVVVLAFASALLAVGGINSLGTLKSGEAQSYSMQIEAANAVRSEIEQGIDFTISETMRTELASGERDAARLKQKALFAVRNFAEQEQLQRGKGIAVRFHSAQGYFGTASGLAALSSHSDVNWGAFEANTNLLLLSPTPNVLIAEFAYTGGISMSSVFYATIETENFTQVFALPQGYTNRVIVFAA